MVAGSECGSGGRRECGSPKSSYLYRGCQFRTFGLS